MEKLLIVVS